MTSKDRDKLMIVLLREVTLVCPKGTPQYAKLYDLYTIGQGLMTEFRQLNAIQVEHKIEGVNVYGA